MKKLRKKVTAGTQQYVMAYCSCVCSGCGPTAYDTTWSRSYTPNRY